MRSKTVDSLSSQSSCCRRRGKRRTKRREEYSTHSVLVFLCLQSVRERQRDAPVQSVSVYDSCGFGALPRCWLVIEEVEMCVFVCGYVRGKTKDVRKSVLRGRDEEKNATVHNVQSNCQFTFFLEIKQQRGDKNAKTNKQKHGTLLFSWRRFHQRSRQRMVKKRLEQLIATEGIRAPNLHQQLSFEQLPLQK